MIFRLVHAEARQRAAAAIAAAPDGWIVKINEPTRNLEQNAKFHALCSEVARTRKYAGRKLTGEQWKVLFVSGHSIATGRGADMVPGLENEFVNIRESTASMSKARMSSLVEYVNAWIASTED